MMRLPVPVLAATFACALVAASHAPIGRCGSDGQVALGIVELSSGTPDATFYVDDRNYALGNGIWIYQEANGIWTSQGAGLHQGDVAAHNLQRGSACGGPLLSPSECIVPSTTGTEICTDLVDWWPDLLLF